MKILSVANNRVNNNISFKRSIKEHNSWGVRIDSQQPTVKIFTFPDAKAVFLEVNQGKQDERIFQLEKKENGIFESKLEKNAIKEGDRYQFIIEKADGTIEKVKDPYSFRQPELTGASQVYNHNSYKWKDANWRVNPDRISRIASAENGFTPLENASNI